VGDARRTLVLSLRRLWEKLLTQCALALLRLEESIFSIVLEEPFNPPDIFL
jgi:hypothetical protein